MGRGMRAGKRPKQGGGKMSQAQQMQQIQQMQRQMQEMQAELEEKEVTSSAGGGVVNVTVNGKHELVDLKIDEAVVDPDDIETLQDLILAAVNEGMRQIDEMQESEYGKLTGGLGVPGM